MNKPDMCLLSNHASCRVPKIGFYTSQDYLDVSVVDYALSVLFLGIPWFYPFTGYLNWLPLKAAEIYTPVKESRQTDTNTQTGQTEARRKL